MLASFFRCLYDCKMRGVGVDKLWWVPSRKGLFEMKSFYRVLSLTGVTLFPWKSIWRFMAPSRVAFFAWTAARGKILTMDNLRRRGMVVVNRCWLCESDEESVDHLLLHCGVARALWNAFFARFGLYWVMLYSIKELFASWWSNGRTRSAVVWKMVPLVLCGVFGGSKMIDVLMTLRGLARSSFIFFFLPFSLGQQAALPCG